MRQPSNAPDFCADQVLHLAQNNTLGLRFPYQEPSSIYSRGASNDSVELDYNSVVAAAPSGISHTAGVSSGFVEIASENLRTRPLIAR